MDAEIIMHYSLLGIFIIQTYFISFSIASFLFTNTNIHCTTFRPISISLSLSFRPHYTSSAQKAQSIAAIDVMANRRKPLKDDDYSGWDRKRHTT
ncbi:hypothetical protein ACS0TY_034758 [Phlomoides rotata]